MIDQDGRIVRFGPFSGLSGSRRADTTLGMPQPTPLRGGYNVELLDGELWVRRGTDFEGGTKVSYASVPWSWVIEFSPTISVLASPYYAIYLRTNGTVSNITNPAIASESITFDGTSTAISTSTLQKNDMIFVGTTAFASSEVYRAIAVSGTTVTLDRASTTSGVATCRVLRSYFGASLDIPDVVSYTADLPHGHYAVMDQLVTHGANDLWAGSPATSNVRYLIIAHQELSDAGFGPVAVPFDPTLEFAGGSGTNWFRDTSLASPPAVSPEPTTCCVVDNRLVMAGAGDPQGLFAERTLWSSWPGDFLLWHAGLSGQNAAPLYVTFDGISNTIQAVRADGPNLVVHRQVSQEIGVPQGSASAPFAYRSNEQGLGMTDPQGICVANRVQYLMTQAGPAGFSSDTGVQPLALEHRSTLQAMGLWNRARFIAHDPATLRVYFFSVSNGRHSAAALPPTDTSVPIGVTGNTWANTTMALVYDYGQNAWWFEEHISPMGWGEAGASTMFLCRPDGTVIQVDNLGATGLDPDDTTGTNVVDALADLPWFDLAGPGKRGKIKQMVVGLRAVDISESTSNQEIDDLWSATTDILHFGTVEVYTDYDMTTAADAMDMNQIVSVMRARASSENNQLPIIEFKLSGFRVSAISARIRIKNALSAAATTAGHKKGHFRLAYINVWITGGEGDRLEAPFGGS
jgi:hypothetical protein